MIKDMDYQQKFSFLSRWLGSIIELVRKDLKNEHWKVDKGFCNKNFLGKNPNLISTEELVAIYSKEVTEGNIGLAEFIANRWILKNTEVYEFFETELNKISPDFDKINQIDAKAAKQMMAESVELFGWRRTFLFSVLNSVAFPEELFQELHCHAEEEEKEISAQEFEKENTRSLEHLARRHEREKKALIDRFEKKLLGMQKKYHRDISSLQKKIDELKNSPLQ